MPKEMKTFRTMTDNKKTVKANPGSRIEEIKAMKLDEFGNEEFYVKGKTNLYEKIQMFRDECDLEQILIRCTETGDLSLINKVQPFYADLEDMPDNIFEAHRKIIEAQQTFNNMPLNIREEYGFDFNRFLADIGSNKWIQTFEKIKDKTPNETPQEVTENE